MNGWADVPDVVCIGHFHKASYNVWQGVHTNKSGCFKDQTTFMEKKPLAAHVGGWIVEMRVNDEGEVVAINTEFFPMHNTKKKGAMIETKDGTFLVQD
jgi:DNA polymerase II small subunit/DNA polymerase delta subunit B